MVEDDNPFVAEILFSDKLYCKAGNIGFYLIWLF